MTPQLVQILEDNVQQFERLNKIVLEENSTIEPQLAQLDELSRQLMDFGTAFDVSKNDEFFYLPPESFANPYFQIDEKYFIFPDGHAARYLIYHDGEALTEAGIQHDQTFLPAVERGSERHDSGGCSRVPRRRRGHIHWDVKDATKIDLLIAATAAFALIFLVMLFITRAIIAALVIVGTVAFSFSRGVRDVRADLAEPPRNSVELVEHCLLLHPAGGRWVRLQPIARRPLSA